MALVESSPEPAEQSAASPKDSVEPPEFFAGEAFVVQRGSHCHWGVRSLTEEWRSSYTPSRSSANKRN